MSVNQASFSADNVGSPDNGHQYGPFNLGFCKTLLRVTADLYLGIPGGTITVGGSSSFGLIWGFQWVPHGNSPFVLPGDAFEQNFLWAEFATNNNNFTTTWAPSTDSAAFLSGNSVRGSWRGQLPINADIDVYVTTGNHFGSGSFSGTTLMRVTNST
jgi:hypothetical protein